MVIGNIWNLFSKSHGINAGTSIFYDLYVNDKIGHKIVSTIECEALDLIQTRHFMQQKMKHIVKKHPHFGSRIINHNWMKVEDLNYDKLVIICDKKRDEVANEILNSNCGYVCKPGKPSIISELILKMYNLSQEERKNLGLNGYNFIKHNRSIATQGYSFLNILK